MGKKVRGGYHDTHAMHGRQENARWCLGFLSEGYSHLELSASPKLIPKPCIPQIESQSSYIAELPKVQSN